MRLLTCLAEENVYRLVQLLRDNIALVASLAELHVVFIGSHHKQVNRVLGNSNTGSVTVSLVLVTFSGFNTDGLNHLDGQMQTYLWSQCSHLPEHQDSGQVSGNTKPIQLGLSEAKSPI